MTKMYVASSALVQDVENEIDDPAKVDLDSMARPTFTECCLALTTGWVDKLKADLLEEYVGMFYDPAFGGGGFDAKTITWETAGWIDTEATGEPRRPYQEWTLVDVTEDVGLIVVEQTSLDTYGGQILN